uniref:DUF6161 domain-containing protein n=3 Tax=Rhizobium rhizogenes TaxID=359 RepID=A0A7S4ZVC4_RHIRH|nr:hypothetical protein pC6.5c_635 [Rhizobium rhizogenes]
MLFETAARKYMDRATYTFLQTPFVRVSEEVSIAPENLRADWLDLTQRTIQAIGPAEGLTPYLALLRQIRADFDVRTLPSSLVWMPQTLRPISTARKELFLKQLEANIRDVPANAPALSLALAGQWVFEFKYIFALFAKPKAGYESGTFTGDPGMDLAIAAEAASYAAFANDGRDLEDRIEKALESQRAQFETVLLQGQQAVNRLNENIIDLQSKDEELRTKIDGYEETLVDLIKRRAAADTALTGLEERVSKSDDNIEKFTKAIERKYAMGATRDYWNNQAKTAGRDFWISVFIMAVLLIGGALTLIFGHTAILNTLQDILITPESLRPDLTLIQLTVISINRLILIVLPLALLIWFARLVVRYMNRSLALADDAQLRQAMMDTFLRLDIDSELSKEERNVMLSALYRPGPGQSPDLPDFPNVIELINKIPIGK